MARIPRMHRSPRLPEYQTVDGRFFINRIADICSCWKKETKTVQIVGWWFRVECYESVSSARVIQQRKTLSSFSYEETWLTNCSVLADAEQPELLIGPDIFFVFWWVFLVSLQKKKVMKEPKVLSIAKCFRQEFLKTDLIDYRVEIQGSIWNDDDVPS